MSGKSIATIYFYIISAISLILIIIGIFNVVNLVINSTQYDKYPLKYSQPDCEQAVYPYPVAAPDFKIASSSAIDQQKQKIGCEKQQELDRKQHKLDDIKNALTFSLVGVVLFLIHFPQARKQSKV